MTTVVIKRTEGETTFTAGKLFIGRDYFCDTLEDPCRDINHNGRFDGAERKIAGDTCIPCGVYDCTFETTTLGIGRNPRVRGGKIPLVHNVPSFTGIRIHQGNTPGDTAGCILLGQKSGFGRIAASTDTCIKFYEKVDYGPFKLIITDDFANV